MEETLHCRHVASGNAEAMVSLMQLKIVSFSLENNWEVLCAIRSLTELAVVRPEAKDTKSRPDATSVANTLSRHVKVTSQHCPQTQGQQVQLGDGSNEVQRLTAEFRHPVATPTV